MVSYTYNNNKICTEPSTLFDAVYGLCIQINTSISDYKMQDPVLMKEVRSFQPTALKHTPQLKRNLKPVSSMTTILVQCGNGFSSGILLLLINHDSARLILYLSLMHANMMHVCTCLTASVGNKCRLSY